VTYDPICLLDAMSAIIVRNKGMPVITVDLADELDLKIMLNCVYFGVVEKAIARQLVAPRVGDGPDGFLVYLGLAGGLLRCIAGRVDYSVVV
jgi:hypothetical protein